VLGGGWVCWWSERFFSGLGSVLVIVRSFSKVVSPMLGSCST